MLPSLQRWNLPGTKSKVRQFMKNLYVAGNQQYTGRFHLENKDLEHTDIWKILFLPSIFRLGFPNHEVLICRKTCLRLDIKVASESLLRGHPTQGKFPVENQFIQLKYTKFC